MRLAFVAAALQAASTASAVLIDGLCSTKLGISSVQNVPTSTKTIGLPLTAYLAVCASTTKTITPKPTTTTLTDTSTSTMTTTAQQLTGTITTTNTGNCLLLLPLHSTLQLIVTKILLRTPSPSRQSSRLQQQLLLLSPTPPLPQAVNCVKYQREVTTKKITIPLCTKTKTTTLATVVATVRQTVSTTTTSTEVPPAATVTDTASTTVTVLASTTSTQTDTATATETQTSTAPSATFYAACAANNVVNSANGNQGITVLYFNVPPSTNTVTQNGAKTAYDCCVACQQTANCIYAGFVPSPICFLTIAPTCSPGNTFGTMYQTGGQPADGSSFSVSNGPCGRVANGGGS